MTIVQVDEYIGPLPEFLARVASLVKQINETSRPMVLTQRGRGVTVLVNAQEYERMQDYLELLGEIDKTEAYIVEG